MRRVVLPSEVSKQRSTQPAIQPSSLPLIPLNQEESLVQPAKLAPERPEPEMTHVLVAQPKTTLAIAKSDIAPQSTPMP